VKKHSSEAIATGFFSSRSVGSWNSSSAPSAVEGYVAEFVDAEQGDASETTPLVDKACKEGPRGGSKTASDRPARRRARAPLLGEDRPPLMIPPSPGDPEVTRRKPLQPEAEPFHQCTRRMIRGL
jgi:hypothetical protein